MTRDVLESIVFLSGIAEGIAIVVITICSFIALKNLNPWVGKSLKVGFIIGTISQIIISITAANPVVAMLIVIPWIIGYIKIHKWVEDLKENSEKSNTVAFPKYLQTKQEMVKGKVRVTEVPYDAVQLM